MRARSAALEDDTAAPAETAITTTERWRKGDPNASPNHLTSPPRRSSFSRPPHVLGRFLLLLFLIGLAATTPSLGILHDSILRHDDHDDKQGPTTQHRGSTQQQQRPIIYSWEEYPHNEEATTASKVLRDFWIETWNAAGWNPIVLSSSSSPNRKTPTNDDTKTTTTNATRLPHLSPANQWLFEKWNVIANTTTDPLQYSDTNNKKNKNDWIWYADLDVFPLRRREDPNSTDWLQQLDKNKNNNHEHTLILLERVAPSLVVGTREAWRRTAQQLWALAVQQEQQQQQQQQQPPANLTKSDDMQISKSSPPGNVYWTDTLALLELLYEQQERLEQQGQEPKEPNSDKDKVPDLRVENRVLGLDRIPVEGGEKAVMTSCPTTSMNQPPQQPLPLPPRWLRNKWAVHVGTRHLPTLAQTSLYRHIFMDTQHQQQQQNDSTAMATATYTNTMTTTHEALIFPHHRVKVAQGLLNYFSQPSCQT